MKFIFLNFSIKFQSIIEIPLFIILLRILDIRSTGGDLHDALPCVNNKTQNEVSTENSDVIENEDSDVSEERRRVTAVQSRTMDQVSSVDLSVDIIFMNKMEYLQTLLVIPCSSILWG